MVLEFLGLKPDATYYERDLESKIITHASRYQLYLPTEEQLLAELKKIE